MTFYQKKIPPLSMARAGVIAALYLALTLVAHPISYGPVQLRVSEALTVLPILFPEAVPGLFIGVLFANLFGGLGLVDIIGGSLTTLLAAAVTYRYRDSIIAYLSPILFNAFLISLYLRVLFGLPYWFTVLSIGASQSIVVLGLGVPLVKVLRNWQENK